MLATQSKTLLFDLPGGIPLELVWLPPGRFRMGSDAEDAYEKEQPVYEVAISRGFWMGKYPVTQAQWASVMDFNPSSFRGHDRPVENVSWLDVMTGNQDQHGRLSYVEALTSLVASSIPEGCSFRLPTEAEWEYAARGGVDTVYAGGDQLEEVGWFRNKSHEETKPVGLKAANGFGLYDMSGNVDEWCLDWFNSDYYQACADQGLVKNPFNKSSSYFRVARGGSCFSGESLCRVVHRRAWRPTSRRRYLGFRLVLSSLPFGAGRA